MNKLSKGERLVFWGGIALLVASIIPMWAKAEFGGLSESVGAWSDGYGFFPLKLGLLLGIVALGLAIARVAGAKLSLPPATYAALCGGATVLLVLAIVMGPEGGGADVAAAFGVEISRGIMLFVGTAIAAVMAWGGYQHMSEGAAAPATPAPPPVPQAP